METTAVRTVNLSVDVTEDADLPRVLETLARAMGGLVLEGIDARLYTYETEAEQ